MDAFLPTLTTLALNSALVVAMMYGYSVLPARLGQAGLLRFIVQASLFSLVGIIGMQYPLEVGPGLAFDTRNIVLLLAGAFGGPWIGLVSFVTVSAYRAALGGIGLVSGIAATGVSVAIGYLYGRIKGARSRFLARDFLILGAGVAGFTIGFGSLTVSGEVWVDSVLVVWIALAILYPLTALAGASAMIGEDERVTLLRNITESERKYRTLFDQSTDAIFTINPADNRVIDANPTAGTLLGVSPESLRGLDFTTFLGTDVPEAVAAGWSNLLGSGEVLRLDTTWHHKTGSPVEVSLRGNRITLMDSTYIQVIASDISKRVEFERQLQLNEARMQQLAATVMIGHEDERRFIAHELHDESSQMLAAMAMELDAARKILENDPEAASARILTAGQMAADAISDLRRLSHLLRSPMLETLGLGPALEELARQVAEQSGLRIDVAARPVEERDRTAQTVLYRCAQEALTNTVRHANASRVAITLGQDEKSIVLSIQDDGSGFIPTEIPQSGIGLVAIRERLGSLGGHLKVDSTPGSGTTIVAAMPRINGGASE